MRQIASTHPFSSSNEIDIIVFDNSYRIVIKVQCDSGGSSEKRAIAKIVNKNRYMANDTGKKQVD